MQIMRLLFIRALFIAAGVAIVCIADTQPAQSRPDTTRMSCAAARALVTKQGGIVLGTGPSLFDRYVSSRAYCLSGQITEPAFAPTTDDRQCFIGYTCREDIYGRD
jgi:hypothetical protein